MKRINVIGCGRVGQTLAALWARQGAGQLQDLSSRRWSTAQEAVALAGQGWAVPDVADMRSADVWVLSVPDTQIAAVVNALVHWASHAEGHDAPQARPAPVTVFHCSGFLSSQVLQPLQALGWHTASVHPVFNFANAAAALDRFAGTPCGLEGDAPALAVVTDLMQAIEAHCFTVTASAKPLYHAAAVFSSNFTSVLQAIALEAWRDAGVPAELASRIHASLLQGSVANLLALGPAQAITGPAARGDTAVVTQQGAAVHDWHPQAAQAYQTLSLLARRLATTGTTLAPTADGVAAPSP